MLESSDHAKIRFCRVQNIQKYGFGEFRPYKNKVLERSDHTKIMFWRAKTLQKYGSGESRLVKNKVLESSDHIRFWRGQTSQK